MRYKFIFCILIMTLFLTSANINAAYGVDSDPLDEMTARELPASLEFSVSNTCSGHAYFSQAVAADNGYVAVYSDFVDLESFDSDTFQKACVDIYDSDGNFVVEFSFKTKAARTIDIWGDVVLVYLFDTAIAYNYLNEEVRYYSFPENSEPYAYKTDVKSKFSAGEWEYECQRSYGRYTKLSRRNGDAEQILVEMSGTGKQVWTRTVPGILIALCGFVASCILIKYFKKSSRTG